MASGIILLLTMDWRRKELVLEKMSENETIPGLMYTVEHDKLTPEEAKRAWINGNMTVYQVLCYEKRHPELRKLFAE